MGLERDSVERQARKVVPGVGWRPGEENRQDLTLRYLSAVATASAARAGEQPSRPEEPRPLLDKDRSAPATPRVREVMSVPAVSCTGRKHPSWRSSGHCPVSTSAPCPWSTPTTG